MSSGTPDPTRTSAIVDLRSDTVTRPTPEMRRAIAEAPVGDDVFGEDPTVNRLQEIVADLLGVEAALFVPSGSMANQIAISVHTTRGDEVIAGQGTHSWLFEGGAAGAIGGVQVSFVGDDGRFTGDQVRAAFKADTHKWAPSRLVVVENTHNMGGGLVWARKDIDGVLASAGELGLATHLDGARLWNAAVASGASERELAVGFDTVSVCLSKGLGAPVGSLLCGTRALVHRAHRMRKMLGGGMRQAGVLAAAGLYALEHHRARLRDDHDNARYLADEIGRISGLRVTGEVATNIIMVDVTGDVGSAPELEAKARSRGLLFVALSPRRFRLVTHLDADRDACTRAVEILAEIARSTRPGPGEGAARAVQDRGTP